MFLALALPLTVQVFRYDSTEIGVKIGALFSKKPLNSAERSNSSSKQDSFM